MCSTRPLPSLIRHVRPQDYATPEGRVLSRDLTHVLNTAIAFLVECRPLSLSMGNAIKALKLQVGQSPTPYPSCAAFAHDLHHGRVAAAKPAGEGG